MAATANKANELGYGQLDFNALDMTIIEELSEQLRPDYNPKADTAYGKRLRLCKIFQRNKWETLEAAREAIAEKEREKLKDIPAEIQALSREELEDYSKRAGIKTDISKYSEGEEWKLMNRLVKKMKENNWKLDDVKIREITVGARGAAIPILLDASNLSTATPDGVSPMFIEIVNKLKEIDPNLQVGRAQKNRPYGLIRVKGVSVSVRLPSKYTIPEPKAEAASA